MCHPPKVDDEVAFFYFYFLNTYFRTFFVKEILTAITPKLLEFLTKFQHSEYHLSADIHCHKAGTKLQHKLALYQTLSIWLGIKIRQRYSQIKD